MIVEVLTPQVVVVSLVRLAALLESVQLQVVVAFAQVLIQEYSCIHCICEEAFCLSNKCV